MTVLKHSVYLCLFQSNLTEFIVTHSYDKYMIKKNFIALSVILLIDNLYVDHFNISNEKLIKLMGQSLKSVMHLIVMTEVIH